MSKTASKAGSVADKKAPYRPVLDNVVVRPIEPEKVSKGGIVLPDRAQEKSERGLVLAVGPGRHNRDGELVPIPDVAAGQTVLFRRYSGNEIEHDGDKLLIIPVSEIMAIVEE